MEPLLDVRHVTISYEEKVVVKDVSFALAQGEILGIVGESGSGKSTLIKAVTGLLGTLGTVTEGDILYKGENIIDISEKKRRRLLGPEISTVFQDCGAALCPIRTIGAQLHESMSEHGRISKKEAYRCAAELMEKIGLTDPWRVLKSYPFELSGGMNQRVGICMAMIMQPSLLLADEPTSALDVTVQSQVVKEMLRLRKLYNTSMILVSHNIGVVEKMADRVLVLKEGQVMAYGSKDEVLCHSQNIYTKQLMTAVMHVKRRTSVPACTFLHSTEEKNNAGYSA